jgi:hypothetical protein
MPGLVKSRFPCSQAYLLRVVSFTCCGCHEALKRQEAQVGLGEAAVGTFHAVSIVKRRLIILK